MGLQDELFAFLNMYNLSQNDWHQIYLSLLVIAVTTVTILIYQLTSSSSSSRATSIIPYLPSQEDKPADLHLESDNLFAKFDFPLLPIEESLERARLFYKFMNTRRSVRL